MNFGTQQQQSISMVSREDIYNFPFPHKLWIAVNSETCDFIKWNIDGTQIEVQLIALNNYLHTAKSIFKIKSQSSFVNHLREYGFQLTQTKVKESQRNDTKEGANVASTSFPRPNYSEIVMHFSHVHFLRHRIDLLANIRQVNPSPNDVLDTSNEKLIPKMDFNVNRTRKEEDLCFRRIGSISQLAKSHMKLQLTLNFLTETKALEAKLQASELQSKAKGSEKNDEDSMIELSADLFENPHDSVLYMGDQHTSTYAGFYGNCTDEQVKKFFGPYLPTYENANYDDGEKRIANLNTTAKQTTQPMNPEFNEQSTNPQPHNLELNLLSNPESTITTSQDSAAAQQNIPLASSSSSVVLPQQSCSVPSSSLEPIFMQDEDILMDEFIRFKDQSDNQINPIPVVESSNPTNCGIHNNQDNDENEENFKNFFNHYRESLNLLYEKQ